jgi:8-amino-7-oxononanoate synthase
LALVARAQQSLLYVDDALGVGVLGPDGLGSVAAAKLGVAQVPLQLATLAAIRIARDGDDLRERLQARIEQLRAGAQARGLALMASTTAIQPMPCGSDARAMAMAAMLEDQGYWVAPIRPPTVPEGSARLRITLSAAHTADDVDGLLDALGRAHDAVPA